MSKANIRTLYFPEYNQEKKRMQCYRELEDEVTVISDYIAIIKEYFQVINLFKNESKPEKLHQLLNIFVLLNMGNWETQYGNAAFATTCYILSTKFGIEYKKLGLEQYFLTNWEKLDTSRKCQCINRFLNIPADTRPVFSASGLWFHMCMASAYATSTMLSYELDKSSAKEVTGDLKKKFVLLRFAALLHDIGKPVERRNHITKSIEIVKEIFTGIIAEEELEEVCKIIRQHHKKEGYNPEYSHYLGKADKAVSGIDRLSEILKDIMKKDYPWVKNKEEFNSWQLWERIGKEGFKKISQDFVYRRGKKSKNNNIEKENDARDKGTDRVALIRCEVRAIQNMIRGNKLDEMKGGSRLIATGFLDDITLSFDKDYTTWRILVNNQIPIENIIFAGGGNIVLISDVERAKDIKSKIKEGFSKHIFHKTTVVGDYVTFSLQEKNIGLIYQKLMSKISDKKSDLKSVEPKELVLGYGQICDSCLERQAVKRIKPSNQVYCLACYNTRVYGKNEGFRRVYNETITQEKIIGAPSWVSRNENELQVGEWVLELIAGHSFDDLKRFHINERKRIETTRTTGTFEEAPRRREYCVVSADGNQMGDFFANTSSINELAEKSAKVRQVMDRSFYEVTRFITDRIRTKVNGYRNPEEEAKLTALRINLGRMICAGDDILAVVPGHLGIPFSLLLGKYFYLGMGGKASLSFGLVVADPKDPIRKVFDLAENIQKEHSKEDSRGVDMLKYAMDYHKFGDQQIEHKLDDFYKEVPNLKINYRPIMYLVDNETEFFDFISRSINTNIEDEESLLDYVLSLHSQMENEDSEKVKSFVKMRNAIRSTINMINFNSPDMVDQIIKMQVYVINKIAKEKKLNKEAKEYSNIVHLLSSKQEGKNVLKIFDSYLLLQFLSGGMI